ncbi:helix-turn-helix domain-containing protein [Rhodosalinus sediminis]|uniref:helix-turn-helix domain-containing protein n=1 Tax=Rhodosalinus sediminis TaxID=1940533 RepID=UPI001313F4B3
MDSDTSGGVAFTESVSRGDMYSPQKAADIAGVSRTTMMSAVKAGKLRSKKNNRGRHRVEPEELIR